MAKDLPGIFYTGPLDERWQITRHPSEDPAWEFQLDISDDGAPAGYVLLRHTLTGRLQEAYPVGARDLEVEPHMEDPAALQAATHWIFQDDTACRRVVLATAAEDIPAIDFGERAGYRYVVDVEIAGDVELSLLAAEPEWVLKEPRAIETRAGH
ncbi:MAG: hypothetical protein Q4B12_01710 [Bowdeniella nasicola]|nr:hypothetical protein [Bowdeniella nasicola]